MAGLVPVIRVFIAGVPYKDANARDKPGHNGWIMIRLNGIGS